MVNSSSIPPARAVGTTQWSSPRHRQIRTSTFWGAPLCSSQYFLFIGVVPCMKDSPIKCTLNPVPGTFGKPCSGCIPGLSATGWYPPPSTRWELLENFQCFRALVCPSPWQSGVEMAQEWERAGPLTGKAAVTWRQQPGARPGVLQDWALRWPWDQSNWWRETSPNSPAWRRCLVSLWSS